MEGMKIITVTAFIVASIYFGQGAAINEEERAEADANVSTVMLELFLLYDEQAISKWKKNGGDNIDDYFDLMVKTAEKTHLGNITCTNISLVLMGSRQINGSSGIEKVVNDDFLDVAVTLENLKSYNNRHREELGNPDVVVLVTGLTPSNFSSDCSVKNSRITKDEYEAYCKPYMGATYFKGICGNDSVAIVSEYDVKLRGPTGLAKQILTLMGVSPDILRNGSECYNNAYYVTSRGLRNHYDLKHPGLSQCAEDELRAFIENISESTAACWKNIPRAKMPDAVFGARDICKWRGLQTCNANTTVNDVNPPCGQPCCMKLPCSAENENESGCGEKYRYAAHYNGNTCNGNGVCFNKICHKK